MSAHGKENILKSIILQQKNSPALVKGKLWKNCPLTIVLFREQKLKVTGRDTVYVYARSYRGLCIHRLWWEWLDKTQEERRFKKFFVIKELLSEKHCSRPSGNIFSITLCHRESKLNKKQCEKERLKLS